MFLDEPLITKQYDSGPVVEAEYQGDNSGLAVGINPQRIINGRPFYDSPVVRNHYFWTRL